MRQFRRKFAPDWVRTDVTMEERAAVWELVAAGHNIARVREKLELRKIYLGKDTISRIVQEAIGEPGIPAELVRAQKPAVQEWIISKRPYIRDAISGAPPGETPQPERRGDAEPTKPTAKAWVEAAERGPRWYRWLRLAGIASAVIFLFVLGIYLWPSPQPKPTTAEPPTTTPAAFFQGTIVTVAGSAVPLGDGGPAAAAQLSGPNSVAIASGYLYIGEGGNNRVRRVDLATGTISTFAGSGTAGYAGDGGPATAAQLSAPRGLALDSGYLYISDSGSHRVRGVDLATGIITTFAGTGVAGFSGDGGPATASQLNAPRGIALDSRNLYIADYNNHRIRRVDLATGIIATFAGTGTAGSAGDAGPATAAQLNGPTGLALDSANLYMSEGGGNRVRRVDLATGVITTFAGTGVAGFSGDGGSATAAQLNGPTGLAVDSRNLYVSDGNNHRVRRVDLATGTISTLAGAGQAAFGGDGGPATAAQLNFPSGVAVSSGSLHIADPLNNRVRRVDLATGAITTFAGGGAVPLGDGGQATAAQLSGPNQVAVDSRNFYISDRANNRIRRVDLATGIITTLAGTGAAGYGGDGGAAAAAQLNSPRGLALDSGYLYIGDSGNNRVRRVDLATGIITTFAGTGTAGFSGDGGPATAAQINNPFGVTVASGYLYIADYNNHRIRRVDLATGTISTFAGSGTASYGGDGGPATAAQLSTPRFLAVVSGSLYITDTGNYRTRRVDLATGIITTFAGTGVAGFSGDGGPATAAQINTSLGLAFASGYLYISDSGNQRVRRVDLATGTISTFAGNGTMTFAGDGGPATAAGVNPWGIAIDPAGQYLYIADSNNNRVRRVNLQ